MILFVNYLGKMRGYTQFSFWISITLVKIYVPCVIINRGKNTIELVGTVLKKLHISLFFIQIEFFERKVERKLGRINYKSSETSNNHRLSDKGCLRLGNADLDLKTWIFGFPIEHKI